MNKECAQSHKAQQGFTLVELAIVLIIVGLLITGVLKGQELIKNAEISSTASDIRAVDAAISIFRDSYAAFPGDMPLNIANARVPGCTAAPACIGGNGDGRLTRANGAAIVPGGSGNVGETLAFWQHLTKAGMIVNNTALTALAANPSSSLGGFMSAGYHPGGMFSMTGGMAAQGHYIVIATSAVGTGDIIEPSVAARLDRKTDDGVATAGTTQAAGGCLDGGIYEEALDTGICRLVLGTSS